MQHAIRITWLRHHYPLMQFELPMPTDEEAWNLFTRLSGLLKAAHPADRPPREHGSVQHAP